MMKPGQAMDREYCLLYPHRPTMFKHGDQYCDINFSTDDQFAQIELDDTDYEHIHERHKLPHNKWGHVVRIWVNKDLVDEEMMDKLDIDYIETKACDTIAHAMILALIQIKKKERM